MTVRRMEPGDLPRVAGILAAAFSSDPPLCWFIPDARRRPDLLRRYFTAVLPLYDVWVAGDGAAAWVPPRAWPVPAPAATLLRVFGRWPVRAALGSRRVESGHPSAPHWYLDYIGVMPGAQGGGTGSALLAHGLARCDADGVPAYLNAGSARSRDLYARHGFEVLERFELPFGGPPLWRMWRSFRP